MDPDITLESVEKHLEFKPEEVVHRVIPRPIFFVTTETGVAVPQEETIAFIRRLGSRRSSG